MGAVEGREEPQELSKHHSLSKTASAWMGGANESTFWIAGSVAALFCGLSYVAFRYFSRCSDEDVEDTRRLHSELNNLIERTSKLPDTARGKDYDPELHCAVCMDATPKLMVVPCNHRICSQCFLRLTRTHIDDLRRRVCPHCRGPVQSGRITPASSVPTTTTASPSIPTPAPTSTSTTASTHSPLTSKQSRVYDPQVLA